MPKSPARRDLVTSGDPLPRVAPERDSGQSFEWPFSPSEDGRPSEPREAGA